MISMNKASLCFSPDSGKLSPYFALIADGYRALVNFFVLETAMAVRLSPDLKHLRGHLLSQLQIHSVPDPQTAAP